MKRPGLAIWFLKHLGMEDAFIGDLIEQHGLKKVKINLIPHNPAEQLPYRPSSPEQVKRFKSILESRGVSAYIRTPRGRDIYAACGQLAAKQEPNLVQIQAV